MQSIACFSRAALSFSVAAAGTPIGPFTVAGTSIQAGVAPAVYEVRVRAVVDGVPQVVFPGGDGWLYAFNARTGEIVWKFDMMAELELLDASAGMLAFLSVW